MSCNAYVDNRNDKGLTPNRSLEQAVVAFGKLRSPLLRVLEQVTVKKEGEEEDDQTSTRRRSARVNSSLEEDNSNDEEAEDENYDCLSQEHNQKQKTSSFRGKKSKPFYGKKKKNGLRELCRKEGLPDHGSEEDLISRHQAFITLYNSECDSLHPMPVREIVDVIVKRENERTRQRRAPTFKDIKESRALTNQMNHNFSQLIANAKHRQLKTPKDESSGADSVDTALSTEHDPATIEKTPSDDPVPNTSVSTSNESNINSVGDSKSSWEELNESRQEVEPSHKKIKNCPQSTTPSSHPANISSETLTFSPCPSSSESKPSTRTVSVAALLGQREHTAGSKRPSAKRKSPSSGRSTSERPSIIGPWTCGTCTFYNTDNVGSFSKCELCETARTATTVDLT